jgi:hypothetical protein
MPAIPPPLDTLGEFRLPKVDAIDAVINITVRDMSGSVNDKHPPHQWPSADIF